jgi:hypothetical protein
VGPEAPQVATAANNLDSVHFREGSQLQGGLNWVFQSQHWSPLLCTVPVESRLAPLCLDAPEAQPLSPGRASTSLKALKVHWFLQQAAAASITACMRWLAHALCVAYVMSSLAQYGRTAVVCSCVHADTHSVAVVLRHKHHTEHHSSGPPTLCTSLP